MAQRIGVFSFVVKDDDDIEADFMVAQLRVPVKISNSRSGDASLLRQGYVCQSIRDRVVRACFYFDKGEQVTLGSYEVDLSALFAEIALFDSEAVPLEELSGETLSDMKKFVGRRIIHEARKNLTKKKSMIFVRHDKNNTERWREV